VVILLTMLGIMLAIVLRMNADTDEQDRLVLQLCCLWVLMAVFHNSYDSILMLPVMVALWSEAQQLQRWSSEHIALWLLQFTLVLELPGLWWKLSNSFELSHYHWVGVFATHCDRLLVLGFFGWVAYRNRLPNATILGLPGVNGKTPKVTLAGLR
jgi:hypothetical protein